MKKIAFFQKNYKACFLFLALFIIGITAVNAQTADSKGTDFWLTFPGNNSTANASLFISGTTSTSGLVTIPGAGFSTAYTVTPGAVTTIPLPSAVFLNSSDVILNNGIH